MIDHATPHPRRWGHAALIVLATLLVGGVMLLWAWNTLAVDLFQAPEIRFKHVLAFEFAIAALTALPLVLHRQFGRDRKIPTP
jgi:hypothetical protein